MRKNSTVRRRHRVPILTIARSVRYGQPKLLRFGHRRDVLQTIILHNFSNRVLLRAGLNVHGYEVFASFDWTFIGFRGFIPRRIRHTNFVPRRISQTMYSPDVSVRSFLMAQSLRRRERVSNTTTMGLFLRTFETLHDLYLNELRDLYSAETQLLEALPKMATPPHPRSSGPPLRLILRKQSAT